MDLELEWQGSGKKECAVVAWSERDDLRFRAGDVVVQVDPRYYRPSEVETLLGDASLAHKLLGWKSSTSFDQLVEEMVTTDLQLASKEAMVKRERNDK